MPTRTRFNPTANGLLHIGHAYMALVNQAEAKRTQGEFILRIEDNQDFWVWKCGKEQTRQYCEEIVRDLEWLGIVADKTYLQSTTHEKIQDALKFFLRGRDFTMYEALSFRAPEVHGMYEYVFYPYAPYLTIVKALEDGLDSINLLVRGVDLLSENAFYEYCCEIIGFLPPRMVYMPRLLQKSGKQLAPLSKTEGAFKISEFRDRGWKPGDLLEMLKQSCLINPAGEWFIDNVKDKPVWVG